MSVFDVQAREAADLAFAEFETISETRSSSPFAMSSLYEAEPPSVSSKWLGGDSARSPFVEAMATLDEAGLEVERFQALIAEFEDEEFVEALESLADEVAARHLTATGTWAQEGEAPLLASAEVERWMESIAGEADRLLGQLESHFGERPVDSLTEMELDAVGYVGTTHGLSTGPVSLQEQFLGSLIKKAKKVVSGVGKVVGKFFPLGRLFGLLRKIVRPLLNRVLAKALGKLPPSVRNIAGKLVGKFGVKTMPSGAEFESDPEAGEDLESFADEFDASLAEAMLTTNLMTSEPVVAEFEADISLASSGSPGPIHQLDAARLRLARQIVDAEPGRPPTEQMEQFLPVVMAARPFIKVGIGIIGRQRVVNFVAGLLAKLIQGMVGPQAAQLVSRHIASAGLGLIGLEAERAADGMLGAEALVATAEDTIREVFSLPAESLANDLLVEAAVQEAFTEAALRHLPAEVLRPELVEAESEDEHGVWVMMPRATRPCYRYKKYSRVVPLTITRPLARRFVLSDGETLEERLLDAGASSFPVQGEIHFYETLPGAELGHLAAFELEGEVDSYADGALEFEELAPSRPLPVSVPPARPAGSQRGKAPSAPNARPSPGRRYYRVRVPGLKLRKPRRLAVRLDLTAARPELRVHLRIGERVAHVLATHVQHNRHVQIVAAIRKLLGPTTQQVLTTRLERMMSKRGLTSQPGAAAKLAGHIVDAIGRTVAKQLPAAATTLATSAKDPATGVTLSFAFPFAQREAIGKDLPGEPTMTIRAGFHRD